MANPTASSVKSYIVTNVLTPLASTLNADVTYKDGESLRDMNFVDNDNVLIMMKEETRFEEHTGLGVSDYTVVYTFVNFVKKETLKLNTTVTTNEERQNIFEEALYDQIMSSTSSTITDRPYTRTPQVTESGMGVEEDPVDLVNSEDFDFTGWLVFYATCEFTYRKTI